MSQIFDIPGVRFIFEFITCEEERDVLQYLHRQTGHTHVLDMRQSQANSLERVFQKLLKRDHLFGKITTPKPKCTIYHDHAHVCVHRHPESKFSRNKDKFVLFLGTVRTIRLRKYSNATVVDPDAESEGFFSTSEIALDVEPRTLLHLGPHMHFEHAIGIQLGLSATPSTHTTLVFEEA